MRILKKFNNLDSLQVFAQMTHSMGNFMPLPDKTYNAVKGTGNEIKDFLDLMLDQINNDERIKYKEGTVSIEKIKEWKEWFADEKENILIDEKDYRLIKDLKSFDGMEKDEFNQLLNMIISRIRMRGLRIVGKINMCKGVQQKCDELIRAEKSLIKL